ncbi:MAG: hypothetical protein J7K36_00100 [Archaeoglobaceae archaeon]|nr:hypothetical protein [Archaeoglobaceae archaeon]
MQCIICKSEVVGGKYKDFGICEKCGKALDDIIAAYFELLERDLEIKSEKVPYYVLMMSRKLWYLEQTLWWQAYKELKEEGKVDDEYFQRLEMVIDWMEANPKIVREIGEKFFSRCPNCNAELIPGSIEVKEDGEYRVVICKKCKKEITRYYMPKKFY